MMAWLLTLSHFLTNELRLYAGLFLVARATGFRPRRVAVLLAGIGGVLVTAPANGVPFRHWAAGR